MLRQNAINITFLQKITDILINIVGFFTAFYLREYFQPYFLKLKHIPNIGFYSQLLIINCLMTYLLGDRHNLYKSQRLKKIGEEILDVLTVFVQAIAATFVIFYFFHFWIPSRSFIVMYFSISVILAILLRIFIRSMLKTLRRQGYNLKYVLIVGTGPEAEEVTKEILGNKDWGLQINGYLLVNPGDQQFKGLERKKILGNIKELKSTLIHHIVDEVIFAVEQKDFSRVRSHLLLCEEMGINAKVKMNCFYLNKARPALDHMGKLPYITFTTQPEPSMSLLAKNIFDFAVSFVALFFLVPLVFIPVAIGIKLTSPGPVFFLQNRVGLGNRIFKIIKFRTMVPGAEKLHEKLMKKNEMRGGGITFKMKNDPRVTPFGQFLRRTSLDELPQLINVLIGEMSLVGPRPPLPSEVKKYANAYRRRITMKPGITCIWQISGRNEVSFKEWMKMDIEYIDHWSFWLDLKILLQTIPVVLFRKGAY